MLKPLEISKFSIVGLLSLLIDNIIIIFFTDLGIAYLISRSISFLASLTFSYLCNCFFVFHGSLERQTFLKFFLVIGLSSISSYLLSLLLFYYLLFDFNPLIATNLAAIVFAYINYLLQKKWVFNND